MGGYSCKRTSKYYAREVYGELKLPSSWAGVCPGDAPGASDTAYRGNIVPEIFLVCMIIPDLILTDLMMVSA